MTRNDTKKILLVIGTLYPNFKPSNDRLMVDAWSAVLEPYEYSDINAGLLYFARTNVSGFAPSVGQLIDASQQAKGVKSITATEAWEQVYKIVCGTQYDKMRDAFNELPDASKRALGSPEALKELASMPIDTVQSVEKSHFIRTYRTVSEQERNTLKLTPTLTNYALDRHTEGALTGTGEENDR